MEVIKRENKLCLCCMENHDVLIVREKAHNTFKGQKIEYYATYEYCENTDEYIASEEMISANDISMKNAYREKLGLLTSDEIRGIRQKYEISQSDLAVLLGWGEKTITRYETHQVQDNAHDSILRKIDEDPEWYISLLKQKQTAFERSVFEKYLEVANVIYASKSSIE